MKYHLCNTNIVVQIKNNEINEIKIDPKKLKVNAINLKIYRVKMLNLMQIK